MKGGKINERFLAQLALAIFPLIEEIVGILDSKDLSHRTKILCVKLALINSESEVKNAISLSTQKLFGQISKMEIQTSKLEVYHLPEKNNIVINYNLN